MHLNSTCEVGVGIGASRPETELTLIVRSVPEWSWNTDSAIQFFDSLDPAEIIQNSSTGNPWAAIVWQALVHPSFDQKGVYSGLTLTDGFFSGNIPFDQITSPEAADQVGHAFNHSLLRGILHPDDAYRHLAEKRQRLYESAPAAIAQVS